MTGALAPFAPFARLTPFAPWLALALALVLRELLRETRELTPRSLALMNLGLLGLILPAGPAVGLALALHWLFDPSWGGDLRAPAALGPGPLPDQTMPELTIVIPAWNEAERLPATLDALSTALMAESPLTRELGLTPDRVEIIVTDDGSTDATVACCAGRTGVRVRRLAHHRGKGAALRAGVMSSRGRHVLTFDADGATAIDELRRLWPDRDATPIVIGSRYAPDARIDRQQSLLRVLLGRVGNLLIRAVLLRHPPRDTQCGFKLFEGPVARAIFARCRTEGWAIDMEVLAIAELHGLAVVERGVRWRDVGASRLRVLRDAPSTLLALLRLRLALESGRLARTPAPPAAEAERPAVPEESRP